MKPCLFAYKENTVITLTIFRLLLYTKTKVPGAEPLLLYDKTEKNLKVYMNYIKTKPNQHLNKYSASKHHQTLHSVSELFMWEQIEEFKQHSRIHCVVLHIKFSLFYSSLNASCRFLWAHPPAEKRYGSTRVKLSKYKTVHEDNSDIFVVYLSILWIYWSNTSEYLSHPVQKINPPPHMASTPAHTHFSILGLYFLMNFFFIFFRSWL